MMKYYMYIMTKRKYRGWKKDSSGVSAGSQTPESTQHLVLRVLLLHQLNRLHYLQLEDDLKTA